jgi:HEPN domain-containing protein
MPSVQTWLSRADQYVTNATQLHGTDDHEAMVQLAQAAEYAIKGLQVERDGSHRRGHDLLGLAHEESVPQQFHSTLSYLEQAYARRYPDDPRFSVSDFPAKKQDVDDLLAWVRTQTGTPP